ncbi:hypothetical protein [Catellatospora aurea]
MGDDLVFRSSGARHGGDFASRDAPPEFDEEPAWRAGLGITSGIAALTAQEAVDLKAQWTALLAPHLNRSADTPPDQRHIRFFFAATPMGEDR